jgi:hypothetical protein
MLLRVISTLPQLNGMKNETLIYALIAVACVVLLTIVAASLINYEGGEDRSYVKRRIAAVSIVVVISAAFFVYFDLVAKNAILNPGFQSMYTSTCIWCVALVFFWQYCCQCHSDVSVPPFKVWQYPVQNEKVIINKMNN